MKLSKQIEAYMKICDQCPYKEKVLKKDISKKKQEKICGSCDNFKSLRRLAKSERSEKVKMERLLRKGDQMSTTELLFLLENDVNKDLLGFALGYEKKEVEELVKDIGTAW